MLPTTRPKLFKLFPVMFPTKYEMFKYKLKAVEYTATKVQKSVCEVKLKFDPFTITRFPVLLKTINVTLFDELPLKLKIL